MKRIKIAIFVVICIFRINVCAYNVKNGEVYIGYDSYNNLITPNQLILSSIEYYRNTQSTKEFEIYQYINDTWLIYDDNLKDFVYNDTFGLERLEFNRFINQTNKYLNNLTEENIKNKNSFTYNDKYYFLVSSLRDQGINPNINGYIIYKDKNIIGYDITFNNKEFKKIENSDVINVKDYGAIGNGINDDTYSVQDAVKKLNETGGVLYFPNGEYIMKIKTGWTPKEHYESLININTDKKVIIEFDDSTIKMQDGRTNSDGTKTNDNLLSHYIVLNIKESSDVTVQNGKLIGDRIEHCYYNKGVNNKEDCIYKTVNNYYYPTHEFGFGINIYSKTTYNSKKVVIDNMDISDMIGDCIIIDDLTNSIDITIKNSNLYKSRRQGISILEANKVLVKDTKIHDIGHADGVNGTAPMSGIDIEPNKVNQSCNNVEINSITFDNLNISNTSSFGIVSGGCYSEAIGQNKIDINNSYIEGLVISKANINNTIINNKMNLNPNNSNVISDQQYISVSNSNIKNCTFYKYDHSSYTTKNTTYSIVDSEVDKSNIFVESDNKLSVSFGNTKLTNSHIKNAKLLIGTSNKNGWYTMVPGNENNQYENCYIDFRSDVFLEINSKLINSQIQTASKAEFNNITFSNSFIGHTWVYGNSVKFNNCNFDNVDISRFYAEKNNGIYFLNGQSLNKICIFNNKNNNNCTDY